METSAAGGKKARIEYIDLAKAFAMFCVIWGHCIQQLDNNLKWADVSLNPVFAFFYAFHMPLFYMMSGFFFKSSLRLGPKDFFIRKGTQLFLPYLLWCLIRTLFRMVPFWLERGFRMNARMLESFFWGEQFWFIRELFVSYVICYLLYKICRKGWIVGLVGLVFALLTPQPFMRQSIYLLVFLAGIFLKEYYEVIKTHALKLLAASAAVFAVCLVFWNATYFADYLNLVDWAKGAVNIGKLPKGLYHLLTGLSGSLFFILLFQKLYRGSPAVKALETTGRYTLQIYIVQVWVVETFLTRALDLTGMNTWLYTFAVTPLLGIASYAACYLIARLVSLCRPLSMALFGARPE